MNYDFSSINNLSQLDEVSCDLWSDSVEQYIEIIKRRKVTTKKEIKKRAVKIDLSNDAMRYRKYHSKLVADIAIRIFDDNYTNWLDEVDCIGYDRKILYLACLIHDIRKFSKPHDENGVEWVQENIYEYLDISEYEVDYICEIILNHNENRRKLRKIDKEIRILILITRIADKLSKLQEESNYKEISKDDIEKKIRKVLKESKKYIPEKYNSNIEIFMRNFTIDFSFENGSLM